MLLNKEQQEAVDNIDGPSLIIAGAGSGKTRVLTQRVVKLINEGASPSDILCVTFTRNAAKEMRERLEKDLGKDKIKGLWIDTFHGLSVKILRAYAPLIGFTEMFSIYDRRDSLEIAKGVLEDLNIKMKPETFMESMRAGQLATKRLPAEQEYYERLAKNNAIDFDGLITKAIWLLENKDEVREHYQHRFRYVMVDEYQDINDKQFKLATLLANKWKNFCAVGDPNQTIFSFQGANVKHIQGFTTEFPTSSVFYLNQNYRCPKDLVDAATRLISNNYQPFNAVPFSEKNRKLPIQSQTCISSNDEAALIAHKVQDLMDSGEEPAEIAILCRTHAQRSVIETAMQANGIPCKYIGTNLSFNSLEEVRLFQSYLRLKLNPRDTHSFRAVCNIPQRGLMNMDIYRIEAKARALDVDLISASRIYADEAKKHNGLAEFMEKSLYDIVDTLCMWYDNQGLRMKSRNIRKAFNEFQQYLEIAGPEHLATGIEAYLQAVTDMTAQDDLDKDKSVKIMTVHTAKGLEFDHVFIPGCEDNVFPISKGDPSDLEEERRLFYVACTRAKEKLYLFSATRREWYGRSMEMNPSQFLEELKQDAKAAVK